MKIHRIIIRTFRSLSALSAPGLLAFAVLGSNAAQAEVDQSCYDACVDGGYSESHCQRHCPAQDPDVPNHNSGFCVRLGSKLEVQNAVLKMTAGMINGRYISGRHLDHKFFDFENGAPAIYVYDWNGMLALVKPASAFIFGRDIALYTDGTHGGEDEVMIVECTKM